MSSKYINIKLADIINSISNIISIPLIFYKIGMLLLCCMKKIGSIQIRYITVYSHFSPRLFARECLVPQIRLNGKWLREAGFDVQDRIKIVVSNKCLVIIPDEKREDL